MEAVTTAGADPSPSDASAGGRAGRPKRQRSITESLLSIVLGLEAALLFFVTLAAFGLKALPPAVAFTGGAVFIVVLVVAAALQRFSWGVWVGWVLQAALLATGFILPLMFFIGAGFVALWIFCFVKARQLTNQQAGTTPPPTKETS